MIIDRLLTINEYSRSGKPLDLVQGVVLHWTEAPKQSADQIRQYFEKTCPAQKRYASAHYVIGQTGETLRMIPETERAYHCGSSQKDPASGKLYTDLARKAFGKYALTPTLSPNSVTIGIELCPTNDIGAFSDETIGEAEELVRSICHRYGLTRDQIFTHHDVVGWKNCPKLWTDYPGLFQSFKNEVFA